MGMLAGLGFCMAASGRDECCSFDRLEGVRDGSLLWSRLVGSVVDPTVMLGGELDIMADMACLLCLLYRSTSCTLLAWGLMWSFI